MWRDCAVLTGPHNVRYCAAVQTVFIYAARYCYQVAVQNDGDCQHAPADFPSGHALVVAARFGGRLALHL